MPVKVEFEKLEHAERVADHLYGVNKENNCLVFADADFDKEAFNLATALEGVEAWEYDIRSDKDDLARQNFNASVTIRQAIRIYDPPKYVIKISLFPVPHSFPLSFDTDPFSFALSFDSAPCISVSSHNAKQLSIDITPNNVFRDFLALLQELTDNCVTLQRETDKVELMAVNIGTKNVTYFLVTSCGDQSQIVQFYPKNVVIERVSFEQII